MMLTARFKSCALAACLLAACLLLPDPGKSRVHFPAGACQSFAGAAGSCR